MSWIFGPVQSCSWIIRALNDLNRSTSVRPSRLALHEQLGQLGVHPEDDLMLVLSESVSSALYPY